ncbi:MAG TPA: thioredoxin-disulfide reductase [Firmicutes bacterium]|nr:thioredoxin-disulfide reductase [Bacillota bacterium]
MKEAEVVVVGGGPAGLAAGLYAGRARLRTALLEMGFPGGQAATTDRVENYPGFPEGVGGGELTERMADQARRLEVEFATAEARALKREDGRWIVETDGEPWRGRAVIIATGARAKRLGCPGEDRLTGRGVSYCATCDGAFFRDRRVHVIGGGDSAVVEALFLTRFAETVTLVHRRNELRATKVLQEEILRHPKVRFAWEAQVAEIEGQDRVEAVVLRYKDGREERQDTDGVFIYVGNEPNTTWLRGAFPVDERGYLLTDERMRLRQEGAFAAGDVRRKGLRQIVTAVADGAIAAVEAVEYLTLPGYTWGGQE